MNVFKKSLRHDPIIWAFIFVTISLLLIALFDTNFLPKRCETPQLASQCFEYLPYTSAIGAAYVAFRGWVKEFSSNWLISIPIGIVLAICAGVSAFWAVAMAEFVVLFCF